MALCIDVWLLYSTALLSIVKQKTGCADCVREHTAVRFRNSKYLNLEFSGFLFCNGRSFEFSTHSSKFVWTHTTFSFQLLQYLYTTSYDSWLGEGETGQDYFTVNMISRIVKMIAPCTTDKLSNIRSICSAYINTFAVSFFSKCRPILFCSKNYWNYF